MKKTKMGSADLTGQKARNTGASVGQADVPLKRAFVPTIDDPSKRKATSTLIQSSDPRVHTDTRARNGK